MATLTTQPQYPAKARETRVIFTKTNAGADFLRVWVADAPTGSARKNRLMETGQSRVQVHEGDNGSSWRETFDKGGTYRLIVQEYTLGASSHGGAHEDDPNAAPSETKVGNEYSLPLYIGQRMVMQCGVGGDTADLVVHVWNDTIRATDLNTHGEATPKILNPSSQRASSAAEATAMVVALEALVDVSVSLAIGDIPGIAQELVSTFDAHLTQSSVHQNNDTANALGAGYQGAPTPGTLPEVISALLSSVRRHYLNDGGLGPGTAGTDPSENPADTTPNPYHDVGGQTFDYGNMPLFQAVGDTAEAYRAIADLHRAHEGHRISTALHDAADTVNGLDPLPALLAVHKEFFAQLAAISPAVPNTQTTGAVLLMAQTGAVES